mgnify:CR=1 FL=1|tara:strand:+ start:692 stop:1582 length:891 start_codon:yes stop_codon:yes gene_type:complete
MVVDAVIGEPKWLWRRLPHPVVVMGKVIELADRFLNKDSARKAKGIFFLVLLISSGVIIGVLISFLGPAASIICVAILTAQRSLADHVNQVAESLEVSLDQGRETVALIVGRETQNMNESEVASAAIESAAENFSDGVIAPLFWFLVGGLPGLLTYKIVNTADSMIGYKTAQHGQFGWASARCDDLLNLLPSRLSCLMLAVTGRVLYQAARITRDARLHRSPNAGWPEAAMAYSLDVALSGPRSYGSGKQEFPWVNQQGNFAKGSDIRLSTKMLWSCWTLVLAIVAAALISQTLIF